MRFYSGNHQYCRGIDLRTRAMYVCLLDGDGNKLVHRNVKATPEAFLKVVEPYRDDVVVAVECTFAWYWIADLCAGEGLRFVLGHALYMNATHGAKAKNDRIDLDKIAWLLRGGLLPEAYVYPRRMRGTRDLLRRHTHFVRKRVEPLGHVVNTTSQQARPPLSRRLVHRCNRDRVAERFEDPSVAKSVEVDVTLAQTYDRLMPEFEPLILATREGARRRRAALGALGAGDRQGAAADDPVLDQ